MNWYDRGGKLVSKGVGDDGPTEIGPGDAAQLSTGALTAPRDAVYASVNVVSQSDEGGDVVEFYADDISLEQVAATG